jgi:negative regulator of sigma E activity
MSLKVSVLLDGQLDPQEVKPVLEEVASDPVLRDRYTIYGLVGDVLRGNSTPDDGFTVRILDRMGSQGAHAESGYDPLAS